MSLGMQDNLHISTIQDNNVLAEIKPGSNIISMSCCCRPSDCLSVTLHIKPICKAVLSSTFKLCSHISQDFSAVI